MAEAQWARIAYKQDEWTRQPQRKKNCLFNITAYGRGWEPCEVDDTKCADCKAFDYMYQGLDTLYSGGFRGIQMAQHRNIGLKKN